MASWRRGYCPDPGYPGRLLPAVLELSGVRVGYPGSAAVLEDLSLRFERGRIHAVVGPTGCGKTTLLKLLAGLLRPDAGSISFDRPGDERRVALIPQDYGLFPWKTVRGNAIMGLEIQRRLDDRGRALVQALLEELRISDLAERWPATLSGGQKQRVAIARALAVEPALLLMDEPFSALDAAIREDLQDLVRTLPARHGATPVLVTHDLSEAVRIADSILLFAPRGDPGRAGASRFRVAVLENDGPGGSAERSIRAALREAAE